MGSEFWNQKEPFINKENGSRENRDKYEKNTEEVGSTR